MVLAAGSYLALLLTARLTYRAMLYPSPARTSSPPLAELRQFTASDDLPVHAFVYSAPTERGDSTVFYFHGNGETAGDSEGLARALTARGLRFVAVEYRGYGCSWQLGSPSEEGLYRDAEAVLTGFRDAGLAERDVTLWGHSLGSGVAVEMAFRGHTSKLVLTAPFTSIPDVAERLIPILPAALVIGDKFDNVAKAPRIDAKSLIIHGDSDELVPHRMGLALAGAMANAEMMTVAGAGHNDLLTRDADEVLEAVARLARR